MITKERLAVMWEVWHCNINDPGLWIVGVSLMYVCLKCSSLATYSNQVDAIDYFSIHCLLLLTKILTQENRLDIWQTLLSKCLNKRIDNSLLQLQGYFLWVTSNNHIQYCHFTMVLLSTWEVFNMLTLLLWCLLPVEGWNIPPTTEIQQGRLNGLWRTTRGGRTVAAFLGIPFAVPPIGPLRFKVSERMLNTLSQINIIKHSLYISFGFRNIVNWNLNFIYCSAT